MDALEWKFDGITYHLALCDACGSASTDPLPDDAALARLYANAFDYRWYRDHFDAKLKDSRIRLDEYRSLLGRRVLDFGGGLGYFSQVAREAGYHSMTHDPFADRSQTETAQWDTVVALHVLEHANDLDRICRQIRSYLAPGGHLILAVPNFSGRGYREQGMRWVWAQPPLIHIHHFTAIGLTTLLERHGFADIEVSYHERWDANNHCDVENARLSSCLDAAWGLRPLNALPPYRRVVAAFNSWRRFRGLSATKDRIEPNDIGMSEMQLSARLA